MNERRATAARAAWFALGVQVVFVATWLLAGALEERYSHVSQYVSELAADTAANPWPVRAGFVLMGLSFLGLAAGVRAALGEGRRGWLAVALLTLAGVLWALVGLFAFDCHSLDAGCGHRFEAGALSWSSYAHVGVGRALELTLVAIPFSLAWATWGGRAGRPALLTGVLALIITTGMVLGGADDGLGGLVERAGEGALHVGVGLLALGLLVWSGSPRRRRAELPEPGAELEPFRFLAPRLSGAGEGHYRWWTWCLRLPRHFHFERRTDYEGEAVWRLHDAFHYENGPTIERVVTARPLSAQRMLLSGDEMPGGGETVLRPGGLELEPCWILVPWWGIHWPQRWSGRFRFEGHDALSAEFSFRMFGLLPTGRLTMRLSTGAAREEPVAVGHPA